MAASNQNELRNRIRIAMLYLYLLEKTSEQFFAYNCIVGVESPTSGESQRALI
jgi:hypothetical protein